MKKKGYKFTKHGVEVERDEDYKSGKNAGSYPEKSDTKRAFHEVAHNEPSVVKKTRKKKGKKVADKQKVAIALSKARRE